jgi:hypothetical protein
MHVRRFSNIQIYKMWSMNLVKPMQIVYVDVYWDSSQTTFPCLLEAKLQLRTCAVTSYPLNHVYSMITSLLVWRVHYHFLFCYAKSFWNRRGYHGEWTKFRRRMQKTICFMKVFLTWWDQACGVWTCYLVFGLLAGNSQPSTKAPSFPYFMVFIKSRVQTTCSS